MPVTLFHGPATPSFHSAVQEHVCGGLKDLNTPLCLVVESNADVLAWQGRLAATLTPPAIHRLKILTLQEFCFALCKINLPRVHRAAPPVTTVLMARALMQAGCALSDTPLARQAQELLQTYQQAKSSGLDLKTLTESFSSSFVAPESLKACTLYQKALNSLHHLDPGDIVLDALELLHAPQTTLPFNAKHLVLADIYPLGPSAREILRRLNKNFPKLHIDVFYTEDNTRADDFLGLAYEELGQVADASVWIEPGQLPAPDLVVYPDALTETRVIANNIIKLKRSDPKLILASLIPEQAEAVYEELAKQNIPASLHISKPLRQFLRCEAAPDFSLSQILANGIRQQAPLTLAAKHRALQTYQALVDGLKYFTQVLAKFSPDLPTLSNDGERAILMATKIDLMPAAAQGGTLTTLDRLPRSLNSQTWLTGLGLSPFLDLSESSILNPRHLRDPRLAETLATPDVKLRIQLERLRQLILMNPHLQLSTSERDFNSRPMTLLPDEVITLRMIKPSFEESALAATPVSSRSFSKLKKKSFSLSELQEYLDCPFSYHCKYPLKLKPELPPDIEIPGAERGSFIHSILQRFVGQNLSQYLEGLEYANYRDALLTRLPALIEEEAKIHELYAMAPQAAADELLERALRCVRALFFKESELYKAQRKSTTPKHCEWSFGKGERVLELKTAHHVVSVTGRIDRIDVHPPSSSFAIIDYKTGAIPSGKSVLNGKILQMPVYILAVTKLLYPNHKPSGVFYYALKDLEIKGLALKDGCDEKTLNAPSRFSEELWHTMQENALNEIDQAVTGIQSGHFSPQPREATQCRSCDYRHLCEYQKPGADEAEEFVA